MVVKVNTFVYISRVIYIAIFGHKYTPKAYNFRHNFFISALVFSCILLCALPQVVGWLNCDENLVLYHVSMLTRIWPWGAINIFNFSFVRNFKEISI